MKQIALIIIFSLFIQNSFSQKILTERERASVIDELLEVKMTNHLPKLMRKTGNDMRIIIRREYNEDPVMKTMLPLEGLSARRRTIMVFTDKGVKEDI